MNKLGKGVIQAVCKAPVSALVPHRNWTQGGHVIAIPPRTKVSYGEVIIHGFVMTAVWMIPIMYFQSQVKVWRRKYIDS